MSHTDYGAVKIIKCSPDNYLEGGWKDRAHDCLPFSEIGYLFWYQSTIRLIV